MIALFPLSFKIAIDFENKYSDPLLGYFYWLSNGKKSKNKPPIIFYL